MYCSQCGKRVMDTMLFCPFCGAPIVIPDQDLPQTETVQEVRAEEVPVKRSSPRHEMQKAEPEEVRPAEQEIADSELISEVHEGQPAESEAEEKSAFEESFRESEDLPAEDGPVDIPPEEEFVPLNLDETFSEEAPRPPREVTKEISEMLSSQLKDEPVRLQGHAPDLSNVHSPKQEHEQKNTFAPRKQMDPDDVFLDGGFDEYDDYEDNYDDADDYDEPEEENIFLKHIRGFVALGLFVVVAAIVLGWMLSTTGQRSLARAGMAWKPVVYAELANQAYQEGQYSLSGDYYVQALARDSDNYDYANSAGVAYYTAQDGQRAEEYARRAVDINPSRTEAYQLLLRLYPDPVARPWEIAAILQKGYQLTGDPSLAG